ncbi:ABC transporter permease [Clostridium sp. MSJ-4]|uniref:ABC transporter permease n=1 Tax=Clostridium simiarum TaxID=2841506 RepID=A0ABS6F3B5_9CLOT|nr:ABC transporter permease [Clostridium simiarum]MBU5592980.1 ABC transporter permease [Clostridium simiarum]
MNFVLECKKLKRTALFPALFLGGILSAAFPIINLFARGTSFVSLPHPPLEILVNSNWAMMVMLNSFLMVLGACIIYHIEFADNAIQRMDSLPIRPSSLFLSKFILLSVVLVVVFIIEGMAFLFCTWKWFGVMEDIIIDLVKFEIYSYLLSLPVLSIMLTVSSFFQNMWTTVGIGVIGIFASQILNNVDILRYFPFLMPYQSSLGESIALDTTLCIIAVAETIMFLTFGIILSKIRRNAQ